MAASSNRSITGTPDSKTAGSTTIIHNNSFSITVDSKTTHDHVLSILRPAFSSVTSPTSTLSPTSSSPLASSRDHSFTHSPVTESKRSSTNDPSSPSTLGELNQLLKSHPYPQPRTKAPESYLAMGQRLFWEEIFAFYNRPEHATFSTAETRLLYAKRLHAVAFAGYTAYCAYVAMQDEAESVLGQWLAALALSIYAIFAFRAVQQSMLSDTSERVDRIYDKTAHLEATDAVSKQREAILVECLITYEKERQKDQEAIAELRAQIASDRKAVKEEQEAFKNMIMQELKAKNATNSSSQPQQVNIVVATGRSSKKPKKTAEEKVQTITAKPKKKARKKMEEGEKIEVMTVSTNPSTIFTTASSPTPVNDEKASTSPANIKKLSNKERIGCNM